MPQFIEPWEGKYGPEAAKYPLVMMTPHMRFSYHTHYDNKTPWLDEIPAHRIMKDGYAYWPVRIHEQDARPRGIKHGDLVKVYNDRGGVIHVAWVTERMKPGNILSYQASAKYDPIEPGKAGSIDRGGCVNLLTPARMVSKNAPGMACNSVSVEIERWEA